jgi:hypothetical protein
MGARESIHTQPARDLDARHQAAELADALRSALRHVPQLDANGVLAARQAEEALGRYRPDGPDLTVELQGAAALLLYGSTRFRGSTSTRRWSRLRGTCGRS